MGDIRGGGGEAEGGIGEDAVEAAGTRRAGAEGSGTWDPHRRPSAWLAHAGAEVAAVWAAVDRAVAGDPPLMGLAAGDRPAADVEVLASSVAAVEYLLAARMHAAATAGALPLPHRGGVLAARGWSTATARRLARCAELAIRHPSITAAWSAGVISSEHVDPIARMADRFTAPELIALIGELGPHWGSWSPPAIARFVEAADRLLHPGPDPTPGEADCYASRAVSFALTRDSVLISGELPRVEGELVMAAIDALADRLRSTADPIPAAARRADALVHLVNDAHAAGVLPTRGGLPVGLTVTLQHTAAGDPLWRTSRHHLLTDAEARWAGCDPAITPLLTAPATCAAPPTPGLTVGTITGLPTSADAPPAASHATAGPAARIAALAAALFDPPQPLAVGRTQRIATPAQRRALAVRDRGCLIPGCTVPAEACQTHHLTDWAHGGTTDLPGLVLLCWAHHRQVDLHMWRIHPGPPPTVPQPGAPPGTPWPANNGAPFTITRAPRRTWRT